MPLPVHQQGAGIHLLQAIHAHVAHAGLRVTGHHLRQSDEGTAVLGPTRENGDPIQGSGIRRHELLARATLDPPRFDSRRAQRLQQRDPPSQRRTSIRRRAQVEQARQIVSERFQLLDVQRPRHPLRAAEGVDEDRQLIAGDVLEEQRLVLRRRPSA